MGGNMRRLPSWPAGIRLAMVAVLIAPSLALATRQGIIPAPPTLTLDASMSPPTPTAPVTRPALAPTAQAHAVFTPPPVRSPEGGAANETTDAHGTGAASGAAPRAEAETRADDATAETIGSSAEQIGDVPAAEVAMTPRDGPEADGEAASMNESLAATDVDATELVAQGSDGSEPETDVAAAEASTETVDASEVESDDGEDAAALTYPFYARVTSTFGRGLRLREGPGTQYRTLGAFLEESPLQVVDGSSIPEEDTGWYRVAALGGAGLKGWSASAYLAPIPPDEPRPTSSRIASASPTRQPTPTPSSSRRPSATAVPTQVPSAPSTAPSSRSGGIVSIALGLKGSRYVWGGTTPSGFDCSGFVSYVMQQAGRPVARDLWGQYGAGSHPGRSALQPGDIVFFQNTYTSGLSHNGISIGNGQFIHAANPSSGVTISSLSDSYWASRWFGATRVG
ncbi:MAG: SH3 domain-containing protein [Chloroflexi bacterium]|nr:SH3 domain-containing protein [Chloroflexota bacterium]